MKNRFNRVTIELSHICVFEACPGHPQSKPATTGEEFSA
jgi:hypothetical protein